MKMRVWMKEKRETTEGWNWNSTTCQSGYMFQWCWINTFDFKNPLYIILYYLFLSNRYLKGCPSCRQQWLPSRPAYDVVTSFLQSLVPSPEPRYAMLGPGMEELDVSLVRSIMHAPDVLPISGIPHRQINGEVVFVKHHLSISIH